MLLWAMACLFLNLAYMSNLRAELMRPTLENPINEPADVFARGANLWMVHFVPDRTKPDKIKQIFVRQLKDELQVGGHHDFLNILYTQVA